MIRELALLSTRLWEILCSCTTKMATTGILTVFTALGAQLPNGELASEYMDGLKEEALEVLEYLTPDHEETTVARFIRLHEIYLTGTRGISARVFANKKFVVKFQKAFHKVEELGKERDSQMMSSKTAQAILHFLFAYYFSYHEAFAESGTNIPLKSFSLWFYNLRRKAGKKMQKEREQRAKAVRLLKGRRLEEHNKRVTQKLKCWKEKWQYDGYKGAYDDLKKMIHVVRYPKEDLKKLLWWEVFKVSQRSLDCDETLDEVKTDALKKYRVWSRFLHPDRTQNQNHGIYMQDLLANRFVFLNDSKEDMLKWHEGATLRASKKKKKRKAQGYKKGGRRFIEDSDSEPDVIEIL